MASTSSGRVAFLRESVPGVLPTNPAFQIVPVNSASLNYAKQTAESGRLDATAQPVDTVKTGAKSAGSLSIEWQPGAFDMFLEAAFRGTFGNVINSTGVHVLDAAAGTITKTAAFTNAAVGQWVLLSGFEAAESYPGAGDSPNNGWWRIKTVTNANSIIVDDPAGKMVSETSGASAKVASKRLLNGTRKVSHAIQLAITDTKTFFTYLGQYVNTLSVSATAQAIVTGEIAFMGSDALDEQCVQEFTGAITVTALTRTVEAVGAFVHALPGQTITLSGFTNTGNNITGIIETVEDDDTVTLTEAATTLHDETAASATVVGVLPSYGGTYAAEADNGILNSTSNVGDIYIDGALSLECFKSLNLTISNNLREVPCIGNEFPAIEYGVPALTGSFEKLFVDVGLWRVMKHHGTINIAFGFSAGAKGVHFDIPEASLKTNPVDLSGGNASDVVDKVDWSASRHTNAANETYYIQVCVA